MTAGHHHCDYRRVKVLLSSSIVCIIAALVTLIPRPHQAVPLDSAIDYHHLWQVRISFHRHQYVLSSIVKYLCA